MLTAVVPVPGRPTNSSISLGRVPAASITTGVSISRGIAVTSRPTLPQADGLRLPGERSRAPAA